jgi:hypothetical protein
MRFPLVRLASTVVGVLIVLSCDTNPVSPRFGNGIAGGPTGSGPVVPINPGAPDTSTPFVRIDTPATPGQLVNVGDSILVVARIIDERQLVGVEFTGIKYIGSASLGTLQEIVRYSPVGAPNPGAPPFRAGLVDTTIRRYLKAATPIDSSIDSVVIFAVVRDIGGNVDSARVRVDIVRGPNVNIINPISGDSVPQGIGMAVAARVQHADGVRDVTVRVRGEPNWPTLLDTSMVTTITGTVRDITVNHVVTIPINAPVFNRVTITATANDINRNPGSAQPVVVIVRALGTSAPRVTQIVPVRLELTDSVTVIASGDGIASLGFIVRDSIGNVIRRDSILLAPPFTSNARANIAINLPPGEQGRRMSIASFAVDQAGTTGYSVPAGTSGFQTSAALAHSDTTLIVFGRTYRLPRPGVVGDIAVDAARGNIFISNMSFNRLEVWQASTQTFFGPGIAVGSQPWGLSTLATTPDSLFVANSGGTNISKVFIGTTNPAAMSEDLANRLRTRTAPLFEVLEVLDQSTAKLSISVSDAMLFSNRPQYVGQINSGRVFFSTRPTPQAPKGMIHYFDPAQPFPDLKHIIRYRAAPDRPNFVVSGADSIFVRPTLATSTQPDTIVLFDHAPGTTAASDSVRSTTGVGAAISAMRALNGSDVSAVARVDPGSIGFTDTSFVAVSGDRNWIAFGNGNTQGPGFIFMASPTFFSPIFTQEDLTNNASERVFGLALDSTGITVGAHGAESYFASVDEPFHLRLQGKYNTFTTGAGIAFHPGARGTATPSPLERLAFVASDDASIEVLDIAHYLSAGKLPIREKLYGPIRVSRRFSTDAANVVAKIYGVTQNGGLVVIDVVDANVTPIP